MRTYKVDRHGTVYPDPPWMPWRAVLLVVAAVGLGVARAGGVTHPAFQAAAHVYVGGLLGAWLVGRRPLLLWLAGGLSVLEVACAVYFRLIARS